MMDIRLRFDDSAFARLRAIREQLPSVLLAIVQDGRNYVRARIMQTKLQGQVLNRKTGNLLRSIQEGGGPAVMLGPLWASASLGTRLWYGKMWELTGSPAYDIVPVNKKALFWPGAAHPVARVHKKAQAPRPFIRPSLEESRSAFGDIARRRIALALRGAGG